MKDAVNHQKGGFVRQFPVAGAGLPRRRVQGNDNVSQSVRHSGQRFPYGFFERPGKNVGRFVEIAPLPVEFPDFGVMGQNDADFGVRSTGVV